MATDRPVDFPTRRPTKENVRHMLEDFVSDAGTVRWDEEQGRFYVDLPGKHRWALARLFPGSVRARAEAEQKDEGRWFEVYLEMPPLTKDIVVELDVITRHQDQFTNAIAQGVALMFAQAFDGKLVR